MGYPYSKTVKEKKKKLNESFENQRYVYYALGATAVYIAFEKLVAYYNYKRILKSDYPPPKPSAFNAVCTTIVDRIPQTLPRFGLTLGVTHLIRNANIAPHDCNRLEWIKTIGMSSAAISVWFIYGCSAIAHRNTRAPLFSGATDSLWGVLKFQKTYLDDHLWDRYHEYIRDGFPSDDGTPGGNVPRVIQAPRFSLPGVPATPDSYWFLLDPQLVKFCFTDAFESFIKGKAYSETFDEALGGGIFVIDPPEWKIHRKAASKMFSMRNLRDFMFDCAVEHCDLLMNKIEELCQSNTKDGSANVWDLFGRFTLDCFVRIAFGEKLGALECAPKRHDFCHSFDQLLMLLMKRVFNPLWKVKKVLRLGDEKELIPNHAKVLDDFGFKVIRERRSKNITDESGVGKHDLVSLFLSFSSKRTTSQQPYTDKELKDITMNFVIAARDTTRVMLSWFLFELAKYPNIEQKILDEIQTNESQLGSDATSYEAVQNKYPYLEACLLESLRLNPPVDVLSKGATSDIRLPGKEGYIVRKGEKIIVLTRAYLRLKSIYGDDSEIFKPERFLEKGLNTFTEYEYPVFNLSPRLCLGRHVSLMQAKIVVINFLKRFKYKIINPEKVTYVVSPVHAVRDSLNITVERRT